MSWIKARTGTGATPLRLAMIAVVAVAAAIMAIQRVRLAAGEPLWFDEAWTLTIAATPNWRSFVHEAWVDVNAPLYYVMMRIWTALVGPSDLALRIPALLAVAAAGALPLVRKVEGLTFESRLGLAALVFAWWGVDVFLAGRCYGLLLALSLAQTLLFADLIRAPTLRRAAAWSAVAALTILTHYYALALAAVQGLVYLALCRKQAVRTWPAALAFTPALAWMAWHAPRLRAFGAGDVAWHATLGPAQAFVTSTFILDPSGPLSGLAVALALGAAALLARDRNRAQPRHLWIAAAASLAALALTLASGAVHPSLRARYLIPMAPGLLLGLMLCAQATRRPRLAISAAVSAYLAAALWPGAGGQLLYGYESASDVLMRHRVTDAAFAWDHEVTPIIPPATLERLGGVFFRRAGAAVRVHPVVMRPGDDVNRLALAAATGPRPGIIWIYNRAGRTSAATHPPRIPELDPRWSCERIGDATVGSLACWRGP